MPTNDPDSTNPRPDDREPTTARAITRRRFLIAATAGLGAAGVTRYGLASAGTRSTGLSDPANALHHAQRVSRGASTPPPSPSLLYGPQADGSVRPPGVPAYNTPATASASTPGGLASALASAAPGDVIEFSGTMSSTQNLYGMGTSANNILVRPPLGQRRYINIRALGEHVCFAGFNGGPLRIGTTNGASQGRGCKLWRCQLGYVPLTDAIDAQLWECFAIDDVVNTSADWVVGSSPSTTRFQMHYCWLPTRTKGTFTTAHVDTLQLWVAGNGEHRDVGIFNSVLHPSSNASFQATGLSGTLTMRDSWFGEHADSYHGVNLDAAAGEVVTLNAENNVFETSIVGRDVSDPNRYCFNIGSWRGNIHTQNVILNSGSPTTPAGNTWNAPRRTWPVLDASWPECPAT